ncbi:MAG TPA: PKD domain-containing protein, partial [Cytophagaceae bacterium]
MKKLAIFSIAVTVLFSCKPHEKKDIEIGPLPSPSFTVEKIDENHFKFTNTTQGAFARWEFGNGEVSDSEVDTAYYPFEGTYTAKLTVYGKGGRASTTKEVVVTQGDPTICDNEIYVLLTGGCEAENGKSWKVDREYGAVAHGGLEGEEPAWAFSNKDDFAGTGCMYATDYNFILKNYKYKQINEGKYHINWKWANEKFNQNQPEWTDICLALDLDQSNWSIYKNAKGRNVIKLTNGDFIGIYNGRSEYEIMKLNSDTLV